MRCLLLFAVLVCTGCDSGNGLSSDLHAEASGAFRTGNLQQQLICPGCLESEIHQYLSIEVDFRVRRSGELSGTGTCTYDLWLIGQAEGRLATFEGTLQGGQFNVTVSGCAFQESQWTGTFADGVYTVYPYHLSGADFRGHSYRDAQNNPIPHQVTGDDFRQLVLRK